MDKLDPSLEESNLGVAVDVVVKVASIGSRCHQQNHCAASPPLFGALRAPGGYLRVRRVDEADLMGRPVDSESVRGSWPVGGAWVEQLPELLTERV